MSGPRQRVSARWILAYDERAADHRLLTDGEVIVADGRIESVGPRTDAPVDVELDLGECLILPGFIDLDAVTDIDHAILDSWSSPEHSRRLSWSREYARSGPRSVFSAEERAAIRRFGLAQLLLHGITTAMPIASEVHSDWAETFDDMVAMAGTAEELGIRVLLGPSYRSGVGVTEADGGLGVHWAEEKGRMGLAEAIAFVDWAEARGSDLVTGVFLPCRVETMTDDLLASTAAAARERDALVRIHALQGNGERELLRRDGRGDALDVLARSGLLERPLLVPHGIFVDGYSRLDGGRGRGGAEQAVLRRLTEADVTIIHCPLTSVRYGAALESFGSYRRAGVRIALGTDSFPPDLIRGIDVGSSLAKYLDGRLDAAPVEDYVRAATLAGAEAIRRPDLGRIAPGAGADLVAFGLDDVRDGVIDDPVRTLFAHGTGRNARLTMVAGRVVARDGRIPGVDLDGLRAQAQELFERMRAAYAERDFAPQGGALFPPAFSALGR